MGSKTGISWTSATWNPILGCSRVSEGCRHCYAETIAGRFGQTKEGKKPTVYDGLTQIVNGTSVWTGKIVETKTLFLPLQWKTPKRIFVNSMSDLFHENVTDEQRDRIFAVMALASHHTFQVLTKRPERMKEYMLGQYYERIEEMVTYESHGEWAPYMRKVAKWNAPEYDHTDSGHRMMNAGYWEWDIKWPLPNVWLGVSAENQEVLNKRVWPLLQTPAAVRFLSAEPLLGPLDLNVGELIIDKRRFPLTIGSYLDWVIVGGESGHHARPMPSHWADSIREQCERQGVAYFHKQNGEWIDAGHEEFGKLPSGKIMHIHSDGTEWRALPRDENADVITMKRVGKKRAGDTLYGKQYHEYPA